MDSRGWSEGEDDSTNFINSTIVRISSTDRSSTSFVNLGETGDESKDFFPREVLRKDINAFDGCLKWLEMIRKREKDGDRRKRGRRESL